MVTARDPRKLQDPVVLVKRTDFRFPVIDPKRDWSRQLNKLCSNQDYLAAIAKMANQMIVTKRCPLILGERVQMLKDLQEMITDSVCLIGETDESTRKDVLQNVGGKYTKQYYQQSYSMKELVVIGLILLFLLALIIIL